MRFAVGIVAVAILGTPAVATAAPRAVRARPSTGCSAPASYDVNRTTDSQITVTVPGQTGEYATRW